MGASAQTTISMDMVAKQWQGKTIAVAGGGESPDVVQLLDAFQKTWPVGIVREVMKSLGNAFTLQFVWKPYKIIGLPFGCLEENS